MFTGKKSLTSACLLVCLAAQRFKLSKLYEEGADRFVQQSVLFSKVALNNVGKACPQSDSAHNNATQIYRLHRVRTLLGRPLSETRVSILTRRKYTETSCIIQITHINGTHINEAGLHYDEDVNFITSFSTFQDPVCSL